MVELTVMNILSAIILGWICFKLGVYAEIRKYKSFLERISKDLDEMKAESLEYEVLARYDCERNDLHEEDR